MVFLNVEEYAMISNWSLVKCCPITMFRIRYFESKENNRKHESIKEIMNEVTEGYILIKKFMTRQIMYIFLFN